MRMSAKPSIAKVAVVLASAWLLSAAAPAGANLKGPVEPLAFLIGCWSGQGHLLNGDVRREVIVNECFEPRINGSMILAEPIYHERLADGRRGKPVHSAHAVFAATPDSTGVTLWNIFESGHSNRYPITNAGPRMTFEVSGPGPARRWLMEYGSDGEIYEYFDTLKDGKWVRILEIRMRKVAK